LKVTAKKLALPIGVPTFDSKEISGRKGELQAINYPKEANIIGTSDYRSIKVPVGIFDEDRLRHVYVIGKTGTGKSKFLTSLMIDDLKQGKGIGVIDPHGDLIEDIMAHIPKSRKKDVIIFDPTDENFPFCLNPLDVRETESKQILAKGFIDIFKKFF
jgi:DNA helicase HerA-like ATPase